MSARDRQVDGTHYKGRAIQPWDIWEAFDLNPWEASAVKYILRRKPGVPRLTDLRKAIHCLEFEAERLAGAGMGLEAAQQADEPVIDLGTWIRASDAEGAT